jgi:serine/threonine-protein kinase
MPSEPITALVETLREYQLLGRGELEQLASFQGAFPAPRALADELARRGWLTPFQAEQLLLGKGRKLRLGPYVLLDQLGEGGMGRVFKARHRLMRRLAAVKVIRREWLARPNAVRRFRREIQAVARLSHPNVIHAYDADVAGGSCYIAMEYAEGADLAQLVRQSGPLPVARACEYARQAALGLQHAHEMGLVHRDVKPPNLLVTSATGLVKVLDLGLARLLEGAGEESLAYLTRPGAVVGTLDFLSPEQVQAPGAVDYRADLYGLGCTLYYMLAGQVPFPGGTVPEKLLRLCREGPLPVESLRAGVPPRLAGVVRRLMAKAPGDRYQSAAEAAATLGPEVAE